MKKIYFKRSDHLKARQLSKDQLNVYFSCYKALQIKDIVAITRLDITQVKTILDTLVNEKLISVFHDVVDKNSEKIATEEGKIARFYELRGELEGFLVMKLASKEAKSYVKELLACSSYLELKITAKRQAKVIALLKNESIGREMLELIDMW